LLMILHKLKVIWRNIKYFFVWIKKVFDYSIVLWDDEDYDFAFIYKLLKYKIERTRKYIDKHKRHENYAKDVANMKRAEYLLGLLYKEDFYADDCQYTAEEAREELYRLLKNELECWWD